MRTTEIFTVLAAILVLIIMRSKAEPFWPFSSPKGRSSPKGLKSKNKKSGSQLIRKSTPMGSAVDGQPGMVYGKRGNAVLKADFDRRQGGVTAHKGTKKGRSVYPPWTGPIGPPGSAVPGRPGAVFGKAGGVASRASYERKFGASLF